MLLQQNLLMLKELKKNRLALGKFCKTGTFSYSNDEGSFIGEAAIINKSILVSFVKDATDSSGIYDTETYQNGYTLLYNQSGDNVYRSCFGTPPSRGDFGGFAAAQIYSVNLDSIRSDIATVIQYCQQAKESYSLTSAFNKLFAGNKMSIQDVDALLNQTIDNLNKVIAKQKRQNISPSFDPNNAPEDFSSNPDNSISHPITDFSK